MTAENVLDALRKRHGPAGREWAFFAELRVGTGYRHTWASDGHTPKNPEQRIDAWAVNLWPSKNLVTVAYEIKVSRSDFLHEIKHPEKRQQAMALANQFFFAAPKGLIKPSEVPEGCGLMEVSEAGARVRIVAPFRKIEPPTWRFLASVARRVAEFENQMRLSV